VTLDRTIAPTLQRQRLPEAAVSSRRGFIWLPTSRDEVDRRSLVCGYAAITLE
jgi:hypothetical protein